MIPAHVMMDAGSLSLGWSPGHMLTPSGPAVAFLVLASFLQLSTASEVSTSIFYF